MMRLGKVLAPLTVCRVFMSMMEEMKVRPKSFGDAKTILEEV